ncbi:MAG: F0F1 ATP synthase subunit gamma [Myxococcota bacterium]
MTSQEKLQKQMQGIEDLRSIVRTMKTLAAASIRQYERARTAVATYAETVELGLRATLPDQTPPLGGSDPTPPGRAFVVFGSDHGLCGRFNQSVGEAVSGYLRRDAADAAPWILAVGARIESDLVHRAHTVHETVMLPNSAGQIGNAVRRILVILDQWQTHKGVGRVRVFSNRPERGGWSSSSHEMLPIPAAFLRQLRQRPWPSRKLPLRVMDGRVLLRRLIHQYLSVFLYRACTESLCAEHTSRLAAMQTAERNLDERMNELTMQFRRERQNRITAELLDVMSGFEVLTPRQT